MFFLRSLFFSHFIILVILTLRKCGNVSKITCPEHMYFNGTCCLQFIVQEYPIHNLTVQNVDCLQEDHETDDWKKMNGTIGYNYTEPWENLTDASTTESETLWNDISTDGNIDLITAEAHQAHLRKDKRVECKPTLPPRPRN